MSLRRFGVWTNLLVGSLLMLCVWAMFVWVASRPALRMLIDMTPQRVNTVDPVTEELLQSLRAEEAEIEFHLFRQQLDGQSSDPAQRQAIAIRNRLLQLTGLLLRRYAALGGASVKVIEHSPFDDTAAYREAAQSFSYTAADNEALVVAVKQKGRERRFRKLSLVSDLAVIDMPTADQSGPAKKMPVPVLKDYQGETAISSALKGLLVEGVPVIYVIKGYSSTVDFGETASLGYGGFVATLMKGGFEVRELNLRKAGGIPSDAAMVMCIEPNRDFVPRDADILYSYLGRGGRLFLNYGWSAIADMNPTGGKLGELLGYEVSRQPVFHRIPDPSGGRRSLDGTEAVARLSLLMNRLHPTTKRYAESGRPFDVYLARELRERAGAPANVRREPLLSTAGEGWLAVPGPDGRDDFRSPSVRLRQFVVGMSCELDLEAESDQSDGGRAVMVCGAFCNNAAFRSFGDLAMNICNWMTERKVLLDIAGARYEVRNLDLKPQQYYRIWRLVVVWVPGMFFLLGLIVWRRRRH